MQKYIKRLSELASLANRNKNYDMQKAYLNLRTFLNDFPKGKNAAKVRDFQPLLIGAVAHVVASPALSAEEIKNTVNALQTAWELRRRIATSKVQLGKEEMKEAFFKRALEEKRAIAKGKRVSLNDIMLLNEDMTSLLVEAYGKDPKKLPKFELPKPKTAPEKTKGAAGLMGGIKKLFETLSTPEGIAGFLVPLLGQVIDNLFGLFLGKGAVSPVANLFKSAIGESFNEAVAQGQKGPESYDKEKVLLPYFNLFQRLGNHLGIPSPAPEQDAHHGRRPRM